MRGDEAPVRRDDELPFAIAEHEVVLPGFEAIALGQRLSDRQVEQFAFRGRRVQVSQGHPELFRMHAVQRTPDHLFRPEDAGDESRQVRRQMGAFAPVDRGGNEHAETLARILYQLESLRDCRLAAGDGECLGIPVQLVGGGIVAQCLIVAGKGFDKQDGVIFRPLPCLRQFAVSHAFPDHETGVALRPYRSLELPELALRYPRDPLQHLDFRVSLQDVAREGMEILPAHGGRGVVKALQGQRAVDDLVQAFGQALVNHFGAVVEFELEVRLLGAEHEYEYGDQGGQQYPLGQRNGQPARYP
ncbi:hypothetical protein GALL_392090 [mine drainage metagenome]|uniref:Uncharacterized protein n=1 Tax=mine drainage metagenome TaxID=410659 RepID=A0A1J5QNJ1_9ZZZZ